MKHDRYVTAQLFTLRGDACLSVTRDPFMTMSFLDPRVRRALLPMLASSALLVVAVPALAHHAFAAEFDADKPIDLLGVVTKIKWVNPHSWLYLDVKCADGTAVNWGVEFGAPNQLSRIGLQKSDVAPGTQVHIKGYLAKNGGPFGYSVIVVLPDGRSFQTGGAQDAPANAAAAPAR
jgi:hypothetical protein